MLRAQRQQLRSTPLGEGFHPTFGQIQSPPGISLVAHPPHLRFSNNTCRYDGERLAFRQSDVYTVVAGSPEILVACSESCRPLVVLFPSAAIYLSPRADRADRGCRPSAFFPLSLFSFRCRVRKTVLAGDQLRDRGMGSSNRGMPGSDSEER